MTRLAFTAHTLVAPSATSANIASDHSFNKEANDPVMSLVCILQYSPRIPSFRENHLLCNPVLSLSCRLIRMTYTHDDPRLRSISICDRRVKVT